LKRRVFFFNNILISFRYLHSDTNIVTKVPLSRQGDDRDFSLFLGEAPRITFPVKHRLGWRKTRVTSSGAMGI